MMESMTLNGVAESIRVYHKTIPHDVHVHALDIEWTDPGGAVHGRRIARTTQHLCVPHRSVHLVSETIPGVGVVVLDCPVLADPEHKPQFSARLLRGVFDTVEVPIIESPNE